MPSIKCHCGNLISLGAIPSNNKFHIVPDIEVENFINLINLKKDEGEIFDYFHHISRELAVCNNCERIWIDKENNGIFRSYKKE